MPPVLSLIAIPASPLLWGLVVLLLVLGIAFMLRAAKRNSAPPWEGPASENETSASSTSDPGGGGTVEESKKTESIERDEHDRDAAEEDDGDAESETPAWLRDPLDSLDWEAERDTQAWQELAWKLGAAGRHEDATRALHAALAALDEDQADRAYELHHELGALYIQRQLLREAHQHLAAACACAAISFGEPSAQQAEALNALGALLEQQGSWAQARAKYAEALNAEQGVYGEAAEETAATHSAIARMHERVAEWPEALRHYQEAYRILEEELRFDDPELEVALEDARRAYLADGRDEEAFDEWLRQG